MGFLGKLAWLLALAVVLFGLNLVAQKIFPTKATDPSERRIAYRMIVFLLYLLTLGGAIIVGSALSR